MRRLIVFYFAAIFFLVGVAHGATPRVVRSTPLTGVARLKKLAGQRHYSYRTLFNLGGKAARIKEYGYAALFWSRAAVVYDGDAALMRNLTIIRARTGAKKMEVGVPSLVEILLFFYFILSRSSLYTAITILFILLFIFLNGMVLLRRTSTGLFRGGLLGLGAILVLFSASLVLKNRQAVDPARAIVLRQDVALRQHVAADSMLLLRLPAALEVNIMEKQDKSFRVSLPGGGHGWVPEEAVCRIREGD